MAAGAIIQGVGAGFGLVNSYQEAEAQKRQSELMSKQQEFNKQYAEAQGKEAIARGEDEVFKVGRKAAQVSGSQKASFAAQGIDISSGSAQDLQRDTAAMSAEDIITIRNNAAREAFGYEAQAREYGVQSDITRLAGINKSNATLLTGGVNFLREGGNIYSEDRKAKERSKRSSNVGYYES